MKQGYMLTAIAAAVAAFSSAAFADPAETKGGIKIKTEDGRFEATVGGRIHIDFNLLDNDTAALFGSNTLSNNSTVFFRRARISLTGKAYGWEYNFVPDFAQSAGGNLPAVTTTTTTTTTVNTGDGNNTCEATPCTVTTTSTSSTTGTTSTIAFQELYIARAFDSGKLFIGQFKPYRSLEELTSSNEITMMERPWTSATGVYGGGVNRQFVIGLGYQWYVMDNMTLSAAVYNLRRDNTAATEGSGGSARFTYAPLMKEGSVVHLGASYSVDNPHNGVSVSTLTPYAGRRGPSAALGGGSANRDAQHIGLEAATVFGPFYGQAEYVMADYDQTAPATPDNVGVDVWHLTLSFNVTGETKPYDNKKAVFKNIKPAHDFGAVELTARYDSGKNDDATAATAIETVNASTLGVNYYLNPNVRFMLNYVMGQAERVNGQDDKPNVLAARFQMNW
ncbi:MAG TPA: porin [Solimonas sp.]|nr:porin [Solimonas sp.]